MNNSLCRPVTKTHSEPAQRFPSGKPCERVFKWHHFSVGKRVVPAQVSGGSYSQTKMMKKNISTLLLSGPPA
ncbi:hypothetical protein FY557_05255 [Chryseobacterium sp. SN22]|uniref:hypothetical protein n=1 Tax=Chryseobacterium sp. SN22 TaxID=2606431 RepID=UPI0011EDED40|nr:hypothetical protein [Chryseobacterium sp. SN22]KAA0129308.1 hypothetical protein FY557_05255 [Chryseobacterium sp. SN22]